MSASRYDPNMKYVAFRARWINASRAQGMMVHHVAQTMSRGRWPAGGVRMTARPATAGHDHRRGDAPDEETFLKLVGERVRRARAGRGMTRRILAQASGVSERYLADLERGAGNASLLVLKQIADAMGTNVAALVADTSRSPDVELIIQRLERLPQAVAATARGMLDRHLAEAEKRQRARIALIGLRGAGKSTIGALLAQRMGAPFIELDREIERSAGVEIADLLSLHGQGHYRALERRTLDAVVASHPRAVIATGGGLVTEPATFDMLLSSCFVVWLKASPEQHMGRVVAQGDLRPMANNPQAMDDLRAILDSRAALYSRADAEIDTSGLTPAEAVSAIVAAAGVN
jgi:XRE family aerobic/anaerobic benzoate catabolism transcriptional regulator